MFIDAKHLTNLACVSSSFVYSWVIRELVTTLPTICMICNWPAFRSQPRVWRPLLYLLFFSLSLFFFAIFEVLDIWRAQKLLAHASEVVAIMAKILTKDLIGHTDIFLHCEQWTTVCAWAMWWSEQWQRWCEQVVLRIYDSVLYSDMFLSCLFTSFS